MNPQSEKEKMILNRYQYDYPMSIVNYFLSEKHLKNIVESMIEDVVILWNENKNNHDYILPIVYNQKSKSYVVDYNFLVRSIAYYAVEESIEYDFKFFDGMSADRYKLAQFLCNSILENMYGIVRINNNRIDLKKYAKASYMDIKIRPFLLSCIQRGNNVRRFNGVPFNAMKLASLVSKESFQMIDSVANQPYFEQVAFGEVGYMNYLKMNGLSRIEYLS